MYKAIVFDLDDTLYEYESLNREAIHMVYDYSCKQLEISESVFESILNHAKNEVKKVLKDTASSHNRLLYFQKMLEYLEKCPTDLALNMYEIYWNHILDNMVLRDGALELLTYCRQREIKIGICTDLTVHIQHRKLKRLGIDKLVDAIVTSEEAGKEKPSEIIYQMILSKLKVTPEDALFIGDNLKKDVEGPQHIGMKTLWLHSCKDKLFPTISNLNEIRGILDENK